MLECSLFGDNLKWNKQLFLVVKVRVSFQSAPVGSKASHTVWGYQEIICVKKTEQTPPWSMGSTLAAFHGFGVAPPKKAALTAFCSLGWHQGVYTLLAQVLRWQRPVCPQPLTFTLSPPAHSSLKAVFCYVSAPSLEFDFCQLMMDEWVEEKLMLYPNLQSLPQVVTNGVGLVTDLWMCNFLATDLGKVLWCQRRISFYKNKLLFWMTESLLNDSHLIQDFGY